jgi:regulatory protein YycI of two-component signal transduction system YycFG
MLVLVFLTVMLVNAAEEGAKKDVNEPKIVVQATAEKVEILKTETEKVSYIIGTQIARNFKTQDVEVDLDSLMMGPSRAIN